jgi:hypothetical protein
MLDSGGLTLTSGQTLEVNGSTVLDSGGIELSSAQSLRLNGSVVIDSVGLNLLNGQTISRGGTTVLDSGGLTLTSAQTLELDGNTVIDSSGIHATGPRKIETGGLRGNQTVAHTTNDLIELGNITNSPKQDYEDGDYVALYHTGWDFGNANTPPTTAMKTTKKRLETDVLGTGMYGKVFCQPDRNNVMSLNCQSMYSNAAGSGTAIRDFVTFTDKTMAHTYGFIKAVSGSTPYFAGASDIRLKDNVVTVDPAASMAKIEAIRVCDYDVYPHIWWRDDENAVPSVGHGAIAQEYAELYPHAISLSKDEYGNDDPNGVQFLSVQHHWDVVNAVKYLKEEVDLLKATVAELQAQ